MYNMKMKLMMRILLLCFLSYFLFQLSCAQNATTDPSEVRALNSIFEQWDTQAVPGLWNISGEPCSGSAINDTNFEDQNNNAAIFCDCSYDNNATCHITKLRVYALNKRGVFPEEFVAMRYLTLLKIDQNYFTGPLPAFIGNMSALTELSIGINLFSGPIPKELGNLKELTLLAFGSNNFSGTLPPELGNLVKLEEIYMDSCGLSGEIPSTFAKLTNMQTLWASDSPFSGKIPDFIGNNWTQLTSLRFQGNSFEGPIPTSFSQLTSLTSLRISDIYNGSSSLDFIKNLKSLTELKLRNVLITGTIPSDIGEYQSLQTLDLSFNNLTGQLPSSLFNLSSLTSLFLGNNSLSGPLPSQKSNQLQTIDLSYNFLSGSFPQWVTTISQLNLVVNNFTFDSSNITLPGLNCLQRNFPCNRNPPIYGDFSIKCGGKQMTGSDGILYEAEDSALGPATFSVTSTEKWAVSNAGLFSDRKYPSFLVNTLAQVTGTDVTPELFQTSRVSPGSLRYYGLGLENGPYTVTLHFAETVYENRTSQKWESLGRRVFDIYIQGTRRTKDFDISKEAGGAKLGIMKRFNVSVSENYLEIHLFWAGKGTCCIPEQGDYGPLIAAVHAASDFTPTVAGLPTTDPSEVRALNSIFEQWDTQAMSGQWNISGEPCSGSAINGTDFESPNDIPDINPAIECDCTYNNGTTCHITKLKVYQLNKRGVFPEEFVALRYLTILRIDYNYFTGPLPAFIGNMSAMTVLYIRFNSFSGPIPKELGNLKELTVLSIGSNNFSGPIPPELGNLVKLERLYMDSCGLSGEIPSTFAKLANMQVLWASDNPFSGKIPDFIGNWTNLTDLQFQGNSFEGPIPTSFSQLTSLLSLRISDIYDGSSSLDFIKNLKNLIDLKLRNALITGTIPSGIGEYQSLQTLDLSFNTLAGQLPSSLFNLSSLTSLFLGNNSLSGPLPSQTSDQLQTIDLSNNFLSGSLPQWVTTISQLNLVFNNFIFNSSNITLPGLNCLQRFPCNRNSPRYASFSINCGGTQMIGSDGILYEGDDSELGLATFSVTSIENWAVSNAGSFTDDTPSLNKTHAQVTGTDVTPELFQTSRVSTGSLRYYGLGLENGLYTVTLHFAETVYKSRTSQTWQSLGRRVFDIYIQGTRKMKDFDISKEAGGVNRAVVRKFNVSVSENYLEIHLFWAGKGTCCIPNYGDYGPLIAVVHAASVSGLPPTTPGKKSRTGLIVGIAVPVGVVSLLLISVILYMRRKKSEKQYDEDILGLSPRPNTFSYVELRVATEDFNPSNKLGEGGYGPVYKGTLSDGRVVAVKQLSVASHQGKSQFVSEIATISAVQHRNLVKLYGCCIEGSHRILVYEYLENKSLDHALFGTSNLHLDWPTRFNILFGTARGLAYLHEESRPRIVHRDVKASNILLDAKLSPKISDFGLAKLYDDEKTHISTRVAGTIGYLAPEYALFGHLTEKADVFGFGVVVLEILSGRPNSYNNLDPEKIYLLEWVWTLHENDQTLGLVDPRLTEFDETEATRLIRAALMCTQGSPMARPSMSRVVAMLSGDIDIGTVMSKPSYLTDYNFKDVTTFSTGRFLVEDDTPSTASKHSNVHLNYQPEGSNASGANTPGVDPMPSPVNVTQSLLASIIEEGR